MAIAEGFEGFGQIALADEDVTDLIVGDGEIAQPSGVFGVRGSEPLGDFETFAEGLQGVGQFARTSPTFS